MTEARRKLTTESVSDHIEGAAEVAEKQAHFADDGVIDKHEKKELDKAHRRSLEARGRGPAQVKAYRQAKWMVRVSVFSFFGVRRCRRQGPPCHLGDSSGLACLLILMVSSQGLKDRLPGTTKTRERRFISPCVVSSSKSRG